MSGGGRLELREVDPARPSDLDAVAVLHMELLPFGPMAKLGRRFIREVCYRVQVEEGLLRVVLAEFAGRPAGFVAFTHRSITFHRVSLRRHWLLTAWVLAGALIERPARLKRLVDAVRVVLQRRGELRTGRDPLGEVVCIAARPEYLKRAFLESAGTRLSEELVQLALGELRAAGVSRVRMLVDEDNKAPLFLYHRLGGRIEKYPGAVQPTLQVWFDLSDPPSPPRLPP